MLQLQVTQLNRKKTQKKPRVSLDCTETLRLATPYVLTEDGAGGAGSPF